MFVEHYATDFKNNNFIFINDTCLNTIIQSLLRIKDEINTYHY